MTISGEQTAPFAGLEDPLACLLHGLGAAWFAWQTLGLVQRAGVARRRGAALGLFAGSCVAVLAASAAYHAVAVGHPWKLALQRVDHAAVFLLIGGTLTAFLAISFHGRGRWWMVALVWAVTFSALAGKAAYWSRMGDGLGLALYLGLSAVGLSAVLFLPRRLPWRALVPMGLGAVVYVAGAFADYWSVVWLLPGVLGPHEIFHVAVLGALALHWRFFHEWSIPGRVPPRALATAEATAMLRRSASPG